MAIPGIPQNVVLQQGNAQAFLSWDIQAGATSYSVQRSTDGVSYSVVASPAVNFYLDSTVTVATKYYYQVASTNADGTSAYSSPLSAIPTRSADLSLGETRLRAQQRADRVGSQFVTTEEWNFYINQAYFELYDLLVTEFEDYFLQTPYLFQTDGSVQYTLPNDFYKLLGVDIGLSGATNAFASVKKFEFIERNKFVYPQLTTTALGVFNLQYRLMGNTLYFIPTPSGGQTIRVWYVPKLVQLLEDTDVLTGVSGWSEYVIVDAAIRALQKEESDVSVLAAQKQMLIKRIEDSAMNRDIGQPDTISDSRSRSQTWGGASGMDGPWAGF